MECLRLFVTLKLDRKKTRIITEFMDNYLRLSREEAAQLREEIRATMPVKEQPVYEEYISIFRVLDKEEGIQEGEARAALRILRKKFGAIDEPMAQRIEALQLEQLENLSEALLDFHSKDELTQWLDSQ